MNVPSELETLRDFLRYAVSRFNHAGLAFGHGFANASSHSSMPSLRPPSGPSSRRCWRGASTNACRRRT
jgi:ribosomal protein L3 glutamine methyltransferase